MLRLPRSLSRRLFLSLPIVCTLALPPAMWAADAPAADQSAAPVPAPAPAEASPQDRQLRDDVDAYFHYAWIGRYDLAAQFAQKVTGEATDPAALIPILEDIAKLHDQNMGYIAQLLLFDKQAELKDSTDQLLLKVQAGNIARAQDPNVVAQTIRDMSVGERGYENHLPILRRSGELAIPVMIQFLRLEDDQHKPFRGTVRRALVDMGRSAVNPLLAAAEMKDKDTLLPIIDALGNLGYDAAGPVLAKIARDPNTAAEVKIAAISALGRLGISAPQAADPAAMYYGLALRFYYGKVDIGQTIDNPGPTPAAPVETDDYWTWDDQKGLVPTSVPAGIFNDLMALRACDSALSLNADLSDAVSLWLDADNKREADLPAGATDPIRGNTPPAHYFNVSAGARHLDDALARSLADHNAAVSLKLTHSLGLIVGRSTMSGQAGYPLTDALRFPDKAVRFEAACALASALPDKQFSEQDLVVPLLVQAIGEGGGGNVLVLASNQDDANSLQDQLRKLGYVTTTAASPGEAVSAAGNLPSVDAIVVARGVSDEAVSRMIELAGQSPQLQGAVEVVMAQEDTGFPAAQALKDPLVNVTTQTSGDGLKKDIETARAKAGLAPLEAKTADSYAMRAALALENLAVGRNEILGLSVAEPGLLNALNGQRPELVAAIGNVLARFPTGSAQQGLARRALDDQTPQTIRVSLFQSLTVSAKTFGNQLDPAQSSQLQKEAVEIKDNDMRSAAAEARGALNLPTDDATNLILSQGGASNQ